MKWYIVWAKLSLLTGGSTPNASQARRMTFFGWGATHGILALGMYSIGYAARVFSAKPKAPSYYLAYILDFGII